MRKVKVKTFEDTSTYGLDEQVNKFISTNDLDVVDIKYEHVMEYRNNYGLVYVYSAMVIYKKEVEQ